MSKGVHSIAFNSIVESDSGLIDQHMHYVDNSFDAACILDKSTLQPTYGNGKFKKMFARQVRGSLPKLLASVHPANQTLEQTVSDKLADLDTKQTPVSYTHLTLPTKA